MLLHCYAIVPNLDERNELTKKLRHHDTPFTEDGSRVSVDAHFLSYRSVDKLITYFEEAESEERGFTVIGTREEVPYDTG